MPILWSSGWQTDCSSYRISLLGVSSKFASGTGNGGSISKRRYKLSDHIPLVQLPGPFLHTAPGSICLTALLRASIGPVGTVNGGSRSAHSF